MSPDFKCRERGGTAPTLQSGPLHGNSRVFLFSPLEMTKSKVASRRGEELYSKTTALLEESKATAFYL